MNKWVYTQWSIDGKLITSKLRKNTIGGNSSVTRGTTAIESLECGDMKFSNGRLVARISTPTPAVINVIALSGAVVKNITLPAQCDFDEWIDLSDLQSGLYILRCTLGNKRVESKVVVK